MTLRWLQRLKQHIWRRSPLVEPSVRSVFTADQPEYAAYDIGSRTYGRPQIHVWQPDVQLCIGNYCSIASGVEIMLGGEHRTTWVTTYPFAELLPNSVNAKPIGYSKGNVCIGSDVWIGKNALILSGVSIGSGAIIGAASVVTKDVEPYAIVAGNPARFIRYRISVELIPTMLQIQWWNWPEDVIQRHLTLLLSSNIEEFISSSQGTTHSEQTQGTGHVK